MFGKKVKKKSYDQDAKKPVIRCSICTGEQVAGFKDIQTGKFEEVMLIKNDKESVLVYEIFCRILLSAFFSRRDTCAWEMPTSSDISVCVLP